MNHRSTHNHTIGYKKSPTYVSWENMVSRCTRPSNPAFEHYRKRGIGICERWMTFENFLADMGVRPIDTSIDRWPNNDAGYEPGNCRWATKREQGNNRMTNIRFEYQGRSFTLADLARHTGVSKEILRSRLCRRPDGWTVEAAVSTPLIPRTLRKRHIRD